MSNDTKPTRIIPLRSNRKPLTWDEIKKLHNGTLLWTPTFVTDPVDERRFLSGPPAVHVLYTIQFPDKRRCLFRYAEVDAYGTYLDEEEFYKYEISPDNAEKGLIFRVTQEERKLAQKQRLLNKLAAIRAAKEELAAHEQSVRYRLMKRHIYPV